MKTIHRIFAAILNSRLTILLFILVLIDPFMIAGVECINLEKKGEVYKALIQETIQVTPRQKVKSSSKGLKSQAQFMASQPQKMSVRLDEKNSLQEIRSVNRGPDSRSVRFQQTYKNIPIWGRQIRSTTRKGHVHRIKGELLMGLDSDLDNVDPELSEQESLFLAKEIFVKSQGAGKWEYENESAQLYIFMKDDRKPMLTYIVRFFAKQKSGTVKFSEPILIIDAKKAELIKMWDSLRK